MQARAMLTGRAPAQAGSSMRSGGSGAQQAGGGAGACIGTTAPPPPPNAAPRRPSSSSVAPPAARRRLRVTASASRAAGQQQPQHQQHPALGRLRASSSTVAAPLSASASSAPAAAADGDGAGDADGGSAPRPSSPPPDDASGVAADARPAPLSSSRPRGSVAPRAPPPHSPPLAPSPEAAALARALSPAEDAGAGALVAALAGSALGVRVEPERYTRLARMFPDGLVDFWPVDLPERARGRAARENPVVPATVGRAALEYSALAAAARSLARCGARLDAPDLLDAIVDCRRGFVPEEAARPDGPVAAEGEQEEEQGGEQQRRRDDDDEQRRRQVAALLLRTLDPPARRRSSSPYTELSTEAIATAATGGGDPSGLALLADAAMARGVARTAPTYSDRPNRREFGAHDFGAAATVAPAIGLAYQGRGAEELGLAVDAAVAATHPDPAGRDGAAIVAASVAWMARRGQMRRRREAAAAAAAGSAGSAVAADAGGQGGGTGSDALDADGPRELAEYLLASAPALRLGAEAQEVLAMVAGALGVVGGNGGGGIGGGGGGGNSSDGGGGGGGGGGNGPFVPQPRHPLGAGGPPLANAVPPGLDGAPGRWRLFWASPAWAALSASAVRVSNGPFPGTGARFAGVAVLLAGASAFGGGNAPAQAVSLAATMGGASAATASVVGAMAGALRGVGWLPRRWWDALEDASGVEEEGRGFLGGVGGGVAWDGVGRTAAVAVGCALGEAAAAAAGGGGGGDERA